MMRDRRFLVVGSGGFLGRHVEAQLRESGVKVSGICDRLDCDLSVPSAALERSRAIRPHVVIHLAASPDLGPDHSRAETRFRNTLACMSNVLDTMAGTDRYLIHVGSYKQYGDSPIPFIENGPASHTTLYGLAKHRAEFLVQSRLGASGRFACLRLGPVYGLGQPPNVP